MSDPLSIAAGSFAVVGVLDVVLRTGRELYAFLGAIKDAPTNLKDLKLSLADVNLLVGDVKLYLQELEASAPAAGPTNSTPSRQSQPALSAALKSLHRELSSLLALVNRHGRLAKPWEKLKYILDERKTRLSLQRLESSKSTLNGVLELIGRRRDISAHKIIREDIQHGVHTINSTLETQLQEDKSDLRRLIKTTASQSKDQVVSLGADILANSSEEHKRSRLRIVQGNQEVIDAMSTEIGNLPIRLAKVRLEAAKSGRRIRFVGTNRDALLNLLLLVKPAMHQAILHLLRHHHRLVSAEGVQFLASEFEKLVASASQEAAASYQGSTACSFDNWIYAPGRYPLCSEESVATADASCSEDVSDHSNLKRKAPFEQRPAKRVKQCSQTFSFGTTIGELKIHIGSKDSLTNTVGHGVWRVGFSFSPEPNVCSAWLATQFMKDFGVESKPRFYTQLTMLNIISRDQYKYYFELVYHRSIEDFVKAFEAGLISPYDAYPGESEVSVLFRVVTFAQRTDIVEYLRGRGLLAFSVDGGRGGFSGFALAVFNNERVSEGVKLLRNIMQDRQGFDPEEAFPCNLLHSNGGYLKNWPSRGYAERLRWWTSFLKGSDYNFEQEIKGFTPLLSYASWGGADTVSAISTLLDFGANIHATNSWGGNSIHCSIAPRFVDIDEFSDVLERKLRVLIGAGCDINYRDAYGRTPSDLAIEEDCWEEWCMAVELNGIDVDEVVIEDERRKSGLPSVRHLSERFDDNGSEKSDDNVSERSDDNALERSDDNVSERSDDNGPERSDDNGSEKSDENEPRDFTDEVLHHSNMDDHRWGSNVSVYQSNFCLHHSKVIATRSWLSKKASLVAGFNEFKEGITLINNASSGNFQPILEFLQDSSLELLASDDDEINTSYNQVYDCIVELQSSTLYSPRILQSLLSTLRAQIHICDMPGNRLMNVNDDLIVGLSKMKRAYLSDQASQNRVLDIIDDYADIPMQTKEQNEKPTDENVNSDNP